MHVTGTGRGDVVATVRHGERAVLLVGLVALARALTNPERGHAVPVQVGGGVFDKFVSDAFAAAGIA